MTSTALIPEIKFRGPGFVFAYIFLLLLFECIFLDLVQENAGFLLFP